MKKVHGLSSGNRSQITVLACSSVVGTVFPPMVISKGECLNYEWTKGEVPNTMHGMSLQGWIDQELFVQWLEKIVHKKTFQILVLLYYFWMVIYPTTHHKL